MSYVLDENDDHILDENGEKIEFSISHINSDQWYKHKEPLHINDNGHLDTEDRHLIVKETIQSDHAVCKKQLDQLDLNTKEYINDKLLALQGSINTSITALFKAHEAKILTYMMKFRNEQTKNRIPQHISIDKAKPEPEANR